MMEAGLLPGSQLPAVWYRLIRAFATVAAMHLTFASTFMTVRKCSDIYLALRSLCSK